MEGLLTTTQLGEWENKSLDKKRCLLMGSGRYNPDNTKTRGDYAGCRERCLNDQKCKAFGYKDGGNCRLFDVSLAGRVSPDPEFPYIHCQNDCTFVAPA